MNIFKKIKNYNKLSEQLEKCGKKNAEMFGEIMSQRGSIEKLNNEIKKLQFSKGGLKATITKLKKENDKLTKDLVEARSGKYILKRLPKSRIPKGEPMKIRSSVKTSAIAKTLKAED